MRKLSQKLRSRRGASITFALLLFLVCAVVSSVVIVAATTASGRLSQLARMDQRYYAVNSAAELLCDVFTGSADSPAPSVTVTRDKDGTVDTDAAMSNSTDALLVDASKKLAEALEKGEPVTLDAINLASSIEGDPLACTINGIIQKNGLLEFTIKNTAGVAGTTYTLKLTLASNVKRTELPDNAVRYTVSWKLHSIEKVRAQPSDSDS